MLVASTCLSWIITRRMVVVSIYIVNSCDWMGEEFPWAKELLTVLPMVSHVCILGWLHQRVERGLLLTRLLFSKVPTAGFSSHRLGCYSRLVSSQVLQRIPTPYPLISNTTSMGLRNEQIQGPKTILNHTKYPGFKGNVHIGWDKITCIRRTVCCSYLQRQGILTAFRRSPCAGNSWGSGTWSSSLHAYTYTYTHRIHVCYIYGNMDPINIPPMTFTINIPEMLAYIPAPWIRHGLYTH